MDTHLIHMPLCNFCAILLLCIVQYIQLNTYLADNLKSIFTKYMWSCYFIIMNGICSCCMWLTVNNSAITNQLIRLMNLYSCMCRERVRTCVWLHIHTELFPIKVHIINCPYISQIEYCLWCGWWIYIYYIYLVKY